MCVLREKLPAAEVEYAVEDALVDAGYKGESLLALASTLLPCQPLLTVHCATSVYVCTCTRLHRDVNSAVNLDSHFGTCSCHCCSLLLSMSASRSSHHVKALPAQAGEACQARD